jgi:hypothetical protein
MALLRGADEIVIGAAERLDHLLEERRVAVGKRARRQALTRRRLLHLDAVLVRAGEEIDLAAVEPLKAGNGIRSQRLIGVADMGRSVRIGDRGRDVEFRRFHSGLAFSATVVSAGGTGRGADVTFGSRGRDSSG